MKRLVCYHCKKTKWSRSKVAYWVCLRCLRKEGKFTK